MIHSVLFASAPFHHSMSFMQDMCNGENEGLNKTVLNNVAHFSFSSPYSFFPLLDQHLKQAVFFDQDLEHRISDCDYSNVDDWVKFKLGIFQSVKPTETQLQHLKQALKCSKEFRKKVLYSTLSPEQTEMMKKIPVSVLTSKFSPTVVNMLRRADGSLDFETPPKEPGDGRVRM